MAVQRLLLLLLATPPLSVVGERVAHTGLELATEDASVKRGKWDLWAEEAHVYDIVQGGLGNSYFLAGLAALANTHPEIIEDAFEKELEPSYYGETEFSVIRFFLGGDEKLVAVDITMPASVGQFFFAKVSNNRDVWPILMEKAWAKLSGTYRATSIGLEEEAFEALTQAPVHTHHAFFRSSGEHEWREPDELWKALTTAKENSFPMSAASTTNDIGLAAAHTFAIMDVAERESVGLPRRVKVYDPPVSAWWSHKDGGSRSEEGDRWLTFQEFQKVFHRMAVAHVRPDYHASITRIPVGKPTALRFTISEGGPFTVQVQWPTDRFVREHGCFSEPNHAKLFVGEESGRLWAHLVRADATLVRQVDYDAGALERADVGRWRVGRPRVHWVECRQILGKEQFEKKSEEEVPSGCGVKRGDRIEVQAGGSEDRECGVVGSIIGGQQIGVLFHDGDYYQELPCESSRLQRVVQCPWQPEDQVEFNDGGAWIPDKVVEVLCGKVKLKAKGAVIPCGEEMLRYPPGCPFDKERVTVRDPSLDQWRFAKVVAASRHEATVQDDGGGEQQVRCSDRDKIKKLTRCDKLMRDQISRLSRVHDEKDIKSGHEDPNFKERSDSIGDAKANCGDPADGAQGHKPCSAFEQFHSIYDLLMMD